MKKAKYYLPLISALFLLVFGWSCKKDDVTLSTKFTNKIGVGGPLIKSARFTARDIIERIGIENFYINDDSLINYIEDTSFYAEWYDVVKLNELKYSNTFSLTKDTEKAALVFTDSIKVNGLTYQRIDSLTIKEAILNLSITTPSGFDGQYEISFIGLTKNGEPVKITGTEFNGTQTTHQEDLAGGKLILEHKDTSAYMLIEVTIDAQANGSGVVGTEFSYDMTVEDEFIPDVVYGYFGERDIVEQVNNFSFSFFEDIDIVDGIKFKTMEINIDMDNYFGVPLKLRADSLSFIREREETVEVFPEPVFIEAAEEVGNPKINSIIFNEQTPGLIEGLNIIPDSIRLKSVVRINPQGDLGQKNFVTSRNIIRGDILVKLPFWFNTNTYSRTDTFDFSIESKHLDLVDEITLFFDFENSFPFDVSANGYFINEVGDSIGLVFEDNIDLIKSAEVDPITEVSKNAVKTTKEVTKKSSEISELVDKGAKKIIVKTFVFAGEVDPVFEKNKFVKILTTNYLDTKVSMDAKSGEIDY